MAYTKTNWVAGVTPLSEANMDHLETQYDEVIAGGWAATDDIAVLATKKYLMDGAGGHSYWYEKAADVVALVVGGVEAVTFTEATTVTAAFSAGATFGDSVKIAKNNDIYLWLDSASGSKSIIYLTENDVSKYGGWVEYDGTTNALTIGTIENDVTTTALTIARASTNVTLAGDLIMTTTKGIRLNTADGSDDESFYLSGGGASGDGRGATIILYGNEHATYPGQLHLDAGTTGMVRLLSDMEMYGDYDLYPVTTNEGEIGKDGKVFKTGWFGGVKMLEAAAAIADTAGYGQFWVKNDTPNTPWFTDDAGSDIALKPILGTAIADEDGTLSVAAGATVNKVNLTAEKQGACLFTINGDGHGDIDIEITIDGVTDIHHANGTEARSYTVIFNHSLLITFHNDDGANPHDGPSWSVFGNYGA